jgi:hypothetical protein
LEHFSGSALQWNGPAGPWPNWTVYPQVGMQGPPWTWGITDAYFKQNGMDEQSLWCCG